MTYSQLWRALRLSALAILVSGAALAHAPSGAGSGFASGFVHPLLGLDHLVAMVAVGLWGAFLGAPAIWLLPVVFPVVMALGGAMGIAGLPLPGVETGIAGSAVVLGACVALAIKAPLWAAALLVGLFAVFHGYAHGAELPGSVSPITYMIGFVLATGLLHLAGIGFGSLSRTPAGGYAVRAAGAAIAIVGVAVLSGLA